MDKSFLGRNNPLIFAAVTSEYLRINVSHMDRTVFSQLSGMCQKHIFALPQNTQAIETTIDFSSTWY